jgi:hypothetical protein
MQFGTNLEISRLIMYRRDLKDAPPFEIFCCALQQPDTTLCQSPYFRQLPGAGRQTRRPASLMKQLRCTDVK